MSTTRRTWINANLATMDPGHTRPYGARERHALRVDNGRIAALVPMAEWGARPDEEVIDAAGRWITPGLIDCHTHLVWGGSRAGEFERRLAGATYAEIAAAGGGIRSTVAATRAGIRGGAGCPGCRAAAAAAGRRVDDGRDQVRLRAQSGARAEAAAGGASGRRSGAGSSDDDAPGTACRAAGVRRPGGRLRHASPARRSCRLPPRPGSPTRSTCSASTWPSRRRSVRAGVRQGGRARAAHQGPYGAALEPGRQCARGPVRGAVGRPYRVSGRGGVWRRSRRRGPQPCCCPGAYYFLREKQAPPVAALRRAGVPMAVATDLNPGTSPFASLG